MGNFEFSGLDGLSEAFSKLGEQAEKVDDQALKAGGEVIKRHQIEGVKRSAKDQPHMQDNITVGKPKENDEGKFVTVGPNGKVAYRAKFLEYGTSKMSARPFIDKSVVQGESAAVAAMEKVYTGALKL